MADHSMEDKDSLSQLRHHLLNLLNKGEAHVDLKTTLEEFPAYLRERKPDGAPHTPWQLMEHMRIAQWDILQFCLDPAHVSPPWPQGYWPPLQPAVRDRRAGDSERNDKKWEKTLQEFVADLSSVCRLAEDTDRNLFSRIPHGNGQTLLREVLLVADHNSYHLGQLVTIRRIMEGR